MSDIKMDPAALLEAGKAFLPRIAKYAVLFFILLLAAVYGFVLFQIASLRNVQPNDATVSAQVQASATPQIDPNAVKQMQTLQDNSVNVQTLFDQARNSPFQE